MSSFPTASADASSTTATRPDLLQLLGGIEDFRDARGRRHSLASVLALGVAAVVAGARSFAAIAEWAAAQEEAELVRLGVAQGRAAPETSTFRRVFTGTDADCLDAVLGAHLWTRTYRDVTGRRVIAVDGKSVRGARTPERAAPHLLAALDHGAGTVLGQLAVDAKSNEIPAARTLLASFDLTGAVVTVDAMHTQTDTADLIVDAGGDYVFTIKNNQPTLYRACKNLPWSKVPAHRGTQTGHGRRATRGIKVLAVPAWVEFAGAAQITQIRRTVTRKRKKTVEVVYVVISADHLAAPPAVLAGWVQGHWGIENRLHWVRDVTFDEDRSGVRTGAGPRVMASLRNTAISLLRLAGWTNIAAALRHHARTPGAAANLLLTC
jgi:predicted transposase YbfD/YdcC